MRFYVTTNEVSQRRVAVSQRGTEEYVWIFIILRASPHFLNAVVKAKISCQTTGEAVFDHFVDITKTIPMPKGAEKTIEDIMLTRYACYLIAQNGDPKKEQIPFAQSYYAIQTRNQE